MSGINDYQWDNKRQKGDGFKLHGFLRKLFIQLGLAALLFVGLVQLPLSGGALGEYASYLMNEGLAPANSWVNIGEAVRVNAPVAGQDATAVPDPDFIVPLSGVTLRDFDFSLDETGGKAVLIKAAPQADVKTVAAGLVLAKQQGDSGLWTVEISHDNAFTSLYEGMLTSDLTVGSQLAAGDVIGQMGEEPLKFSLYHDGSGTDPFVWVFKDNE